MGFFGKILDKAKSLGKKVGDAAFIGKKVYDSVSKYAPMAASAATNAGFSGVGNVITKAAAVAQKAAPHLGTVSRVGYAIGNS
jgi:hypothetical protein